MYNFHILLYLFDIVEHIMAYDFKFDFRVVLLCACICSKKGLNTFVKLLFWSNVIGSSLKLVLLVLICSIFFVKLVVIFFFIIRFHFLFVKTKRVVFTYYYYYYFLEIKQRDSVPNEVKGGCASFKALSPSQSKSFMVIFYLMLWYEFLW